MGISPQGQGRLFQKLYLGAGKAKAKGTALGLAITKTSLKLMVRGFELIVSLAMEVPPRLKFQ